MLIASNNACHMGLPRAVREIKAFDIAEALAFASLELELPQGSAIHDNANCQDPNRAFGICLPQARKAFWRKLHVSLQPVTGCNPPRSPVWATALLAW